jgi:hypothetical protein
VGNFGDPCLVLLLRFSTGNDGAVVCCCSVSCSSWCASYLRPEKSLVLYS